MHKDARKETVSAKEDERKSILHTIIAARSAKKKKKTERKKEKESRECTFARWH